MTTSPSFRSASTREPIAFPAIAAAHAEVALDGEIDERPPGYVGPNLDPAGLRLTPAPLAPNVYALLATPLPRDNGGLVVGERGALVVDAGINGAVARQIQALAAELTDRPILYLANTTYHGDHTFGNAAFPPAVQVVSSRLNALSMRDLAREKRIRARNLHGNAGALDDVTVWRRPDITFEHFLELDLGGVRVQLWHFGPGNGPGDTMVYVPDAKVVWTGNFLGHAGIAPMLLEGGPRPYIASLERMKAALEIEFVVPGHGPMDRGTGGIDWMVGYLTALDREVRAGVAAGLDLEQILARRTTPALPPQAAALGDLQRNMDRLNVLATYRALQREQAAPGVV